MVEPRRSKRFTKTKAVLGAGALFGGAVAAKRLGLFSRAAKTASGGPKAATPGPKTPPKSNSERLAELRARHRPKGAAEPGPGRRSRLSSVTRQREAARSHRNNKRMKVTDPHGNAQRKLGDLESGVGYGGGGSESIRPQTMASEKKRQTASRRRIEADKAGKLVTTKYRRRLRRKDDAQSATILGNLDRAQKG